MNKETPKIFRVSINGHSLSVDTDELRKQINTLLTEGSYDWGLINLLEAVLDAGEGEHNDEI